MTLGQRQFGFSFDTASDISQSALRSIHLPDADVSIFEDCFEKDYADNLFERLHDEIIWDQEHITYYGKESPLPRLTAWYGDIGTKYTYSKISNEPHAWNTLLDEIRSRVEGVSGAKFNSVLLNRYRSGRDRVSWHQDNEPELRENPVIASVSFGAKRIFQMRHKFIKNVARVEIPLHHGSLLLMKGGSQFFWQHQIPKTAKPVGERINLTFRYIYSQQH